jgi:tetratricopeptide (TPR) repeat protein
MQFGARSLSDYLGGIQDAVAANEFSRASNLATEALGNGMRHPAFYNARALRFQELGKLDEALAEFNQALRLKPRDVTLLNAIGMCYVRCNRVNEGIAAFERALSVSPESPVTHFRKGWAHVSAGERDLARKAYERAIELKPDYAEALAGLASIAARDGKPDAARDYANRCLKLDPGEPTAIIALAIVENAAGNFGQAEALLRKGLDDPRAAGHTRGVLLGFLGDALDGQDRVAEAFAAYSQKGVEFRRLHEVRINAAPSVTKFMASLAAYMDSTPSAAWQSRERPKSVKRAPREHVFLLGFLRSGTTLLERVLGMNSDVAILEERESLAVLSQQFVHVPTGLEKLAALNGAALDDARATYWQSVRAFGVEPEGKVFIDKQPLNTFNLPLISKLFPEAKVLFAIRDPRDVVFSCFRRHFEVNSTMFEFLDLADGAGFYSAVMNLGLVCRGKLPLTLHEHRYEDMIRDFEGSVRSACDFLGINWTEEMRDFSSKAREAEIRSPSAGQVRRPLYDEAVGQWRRYATELAPALPILAPWVKKFGYSTD